MAKDPAFLFYSSDFLTGTLFMTDAQVGKYMRLICAQHQHGGFIDKYAFNQIVGDDKILRSKFKESEEGFFNVRLNEEILKRKKHSQKQKENISKRYQTSTKPLPNTEIGTTNSLPLEIEIENENEIVIEDFEKGVKGKKLSRETDFEIDFSKPDLLGDEIHFRHFTSNFQTKWAEWKKSRWRNHKRTYKGWNSEQAAIDMMRDYTEAEAIASLERAIASGWEHVNPKKEYQKQNGTTKIIEQQQRLNALIEAKYSNKVD